MTLSFISSAVALILRCVFRFISLLFLSFFLISRVLVGFGMISQTNCHPKFVLSIFLCAIFFSPRLFNFFFFRWFCSFAKQRFIYHLLTNGNRRYPAKIQKKYQKKKKMRNNTSQNMKKKNSSQKWSSIESIYRRTESKRVGQRVHVFFFLVFVCDGYQIEIALQCKHKNRKKKIRQQNSTKGKSRTKRHFFISQVHSSFIRPSAHCVSKNETKNE